MRTSMRASFAAFLLVACIALLFGRAGAESERRSPRKIPKIEVKLSGPHSLAARYSLESQLFTARLTNRSGEPLVLFVRNGFLLNTHLDWTVTDDKGLPLGMVWVSRGMCGTVPHDPNANVLRDSNVLMLNPGESREFPVSGPSDDYVFPRGGTYHLSMTLLYVPPNAKQYFDSRGRKISATKFFEGWDSSQLSRGNLDLLQNSLSVLSRSDTWNLTLPSPRGPTEGEGFAGPVVISPN